jgi:hypothetical protein
LLKKKPVSQGTDDLIGTAGFQPLGASPDLVKPNIQNIRVMFPGFGSYAGQFRDFCMVALHQSWY